jgi:hypothetical protein
VIWSTAKSGRLRDSCATNLFATQHFWSSMSLLPIPAQRPRFHPFGTSHAGPSPIRCSSEYLVIVTFAGQRHNLGQPPCSELPWLVSSLVGHFAETFCLSSPIFWGGRAKGREKLWFNFDFTLSRSVQRPELPKFGNRGRELLSESDVTFLRCPRSSWDLLVMKDNECAHTDCIRPHSLRLNPIRVGSSDVFELRA